MSYLIYLAGLVQLCILSASALVPFRLKWREIFKSLPPLHRQLYWVYGGYVVLGILSGGLICFFNSDQLADHSQLSRWYCGYLAVFWGVRLSLQAFLKVEEFLTNDLLKMGYNALTAAFFLLTILFFAVA